MADGFDDKMKLKRTLAWKKLLRGNSVVWFLVLILCMAVLWICFNLEANLPALPVVWKLCSSQLFLFMLINVIVIILVIMSGSLHDSNGQEDFYDEFVRKSQAARKDYASRPVADDEISANSEAEEKPQAEAIGVSSRSVQKKLETAKSLKKMEPAKSFSGTRRPGGLKLRRSESADIKKIRENYEEIAVSNSLIVMEVSSNEEAMPAEELQRRSDEFIANFNRHIRRERLELSG